MDVCESVIFVGRTTLASSPWTNWAVTTAGAVTHWGGEPVAGGASSWMGTPASAFSNQVAVSAGWVHTCSISRVGTLICWGCLNNWCDWGQAHVPIAASTDQAAVSAGYWSHTCSLSTSGALLCWGADYYGQCSVPISASSNQVAVSAGSEHTCSVSREGVVICWGSDVFGASTVHFSAANSQVSIATGAAHSCSVSIYGMVVCWGCRNFNWNENYYVMIADYGQCLVPAEASRQVAVFARHYSTCSLSITGEPVCWGEQYGQSNVPSAVRANQVSISMGEHHVCSLSAHGDVLCWGWSFVEQESWSPLRSMSGIAVPCLPAALPFSSPSATPSNSPSSSVTPSGTPSSSITPSNSPSSSVTRSQTPSSSVTPTAAIRVFGADYLQWPGTVVCTPNDNVLVVPAYTPATGHALFVQDVPSGSWVPIDSTPSRVGANPSFPVAIYIPNTRYGYVFYTAGSPPSLWVTDGIHARPVAASRALAWPVGQAALWDGALIIAAGGDAPTLLHVGIVADMASEAAATSDVTSLATDITDVSAPKVCSGALFFFGTQNGIRSLFQISPPGTSAVAVDSAVAATGAPACFPNGAGYISFSNRAMICNSPGICLELVPGLSYSAPSALASIGAGGCFVAVIDAASSEVVCANVAGDGVVTRSSAAGITVRPETTYLMGDGIFVITGGCFLPGDSTPHLCIYNGATGALAWSTAESIQDVATNYNALSRIQQNGYTTLFFPGQAAGSAHASLWSMPWPIVA